MPKSFLNNLLMACPNLIQNIAISLYGLKLQKERVGGKYYDCLSSIKSHLQYTRSDLFKYVDEIFRKTIVDAVENVPYYHELFSNHGISTGDIRGVSDRKLIPLLEKEDLRSNPEAFVNKKYKVKDLICIHTTGTTGTPLKIFCDEKVRQINYAYYSRFLDLNGINYQSKRVTLGGRIVVPFDNKEPPFWRYSYFQKNLLCSSYHLTANNIIHYINRIKQFRPDYIDAYPSSLYIIADYARKHNIQMTGVTKGITTSAETLYSGQRKIIEDVFGVPVFDQYGAAEMCVFVGQCKEGNYHIHSDYCMIEFLREDGTDAEPGEEAEIVCTGFINRVMPLIRYRIGDRGILTDTACPCGSIFPVMEAVLGRVDDVISTPDGRKIGRLSPVLKGFPVKEAQYVQDKINRIVVRVVKDIGYSDETEYKIKQELVQRVGTQLQILFEYVDYIPKGPGGKLKSVISSVRNVNIEDTHY